MTDRTTTEFAALTRRFTDAVEAGDGAALAALFTEDGTYYDYIFGPFSGRAAIAEMLEKHFFAGGRDFRWEMLDPVGDGTLGYAYYLFSFTSTLPGAEGTRVAVDGMAQFRLRDGAIVEYREVVNGGIPMVQLGHAPERMAKVLGRWSDRLLRDSPGLARHKAIGR
ncbi:MAG: nuclear transport factor 2 family protein [Burkholderiales bacterium]|nr:MAG: nuclear transport factor 2 family protein [Burkholderiales bacterium]